MRRACMLGCYEHATSIDARMRRAVLVLASERESEMERESEKSPSTTTTNFLADACRPRRWSVDHVTEQPSVNIRRSESAVVVGGLDEF